MREESECSPISGVRFLDLGNGVTRILCTADQRMTPLYTKKGASQNIQQGDELLVQVCKDAVKTKALAVSSDLNCILEDIWWLSWAAAASVFPESLRHGVKAALWGWVEDRTLTPAWLDCPYECTGSHRRADSARRSTAVIFQYEKAYGYRHTRRILGNLYAQHRSESFWTDQRRQIRRTGRDPDMIPTTSLRKGTELTWKAFQPEDLDKLTFYQDTVLALV